MAKNLAAVLGTGQTKYVAKRSDVSMNGLVREAIDRALADSGCTMADIDAVVVGKAPDFFEGVMMPELFMADATGATNKPLIRVHTAGSVGGSTAIVAASLVKSGKYRRVLTMAWEKQSESNAMWALSIPVPFTKPVGAGAGGYFAPHVRAYIRRSGAPEYIGAMVAVKDRLNGAKNPLAHLHQPDITVEKVMASQMLWDPIRFDETCPSSDGAAALVIGNEEAADARVAEGHPVAWINATALRTEPLAYSGRDRGEPPGRPRRGRCPLARRRDHQPDRRDRLRRGLRAVLVVRADVAGEPGLRARRRRLEADRGRRDGHRRPDSVQRLRRRPQLEPHWCVRNDPIRRVRHPGHGQGRRPPGRRCSKGAGSRVWRWRTVLLDVGGLERQAGQVTAWA
ncbi:hypothetical protein MAUB1S_01312 [Mycolicibacterium aubagnense]